VQKVTLAEARYPGWLERLLTHPVNSLDGYAEMSRLLTEEKSAIKGFVEISDL
jgi:glucose 1-dehydrogenase